MSLYGQLDNTPPNIFDGIGKLLGTGKTAAVFENTKDKNTVIKVFSMTGRQTKGPAYNAQQQLYYIYKYIKAAQDKNGKDDNANKNNKNTDDNGLNDLFVKIEDVQWDDSRIRLVMRKILPLENLTMKEQYKYLPQIKNLLQKLKKNKICHSDFCVRNVGINENDKLVLYDMDAIKFLDPVCIEPKAVFADTQEYMHYMKTTQRMLCTDELKIWSHVLSVYLVDNTKKLDRLDNMGLRRMSYRLIMFYKISKDVKRKFWDVPLSRFYYYKRLEGVNDELIYKIFTTLTSDEALDLLKKFEPKMVLLDEVITHLM